MRERRPDSGVATAQPALFTYAYDDNGDPLYEARSHQSGAGDVYTYDAADRLVRNLTAVADPANEIANPGSEVYDDKLEYDMDDVHNLVSYDVTPYGGSVTSLAYTTNAMNEYTAIGASSPTYDANGNLKDDGSKLYKYDGRNRLIEVRDKGTSNVLMTAKFDAVGFTGGTMSGMAMECCPPMMAVAGLGRRFEKSDGTTATRTIYQGENAVEEYVGGSLARKFVYADGLDRPVMMEAPDIADVDADLDDTELQRFWYHTQLIGSVTQLTDATESVVESYEYGPYGETTIRNQSGTPVSASPVENPWMYTARQNDTEAGLYHYRARAYSPEMKRFVQRDPLEYVDGSNATAYVGAGPTGEVDPLGLESKADVRTRQLVDTVANLLPYRRKGQLKRRKVNAWSLTDWISGLKGPHPATTNPFTDTITLDSDKVPASEMCPCGNGRKFAYWVFVVLHEAGHSLDGHDASDKGEINASVSAANDILDALESYDLPHNPVSCPCGCGSPWKSWQEDLTLAWGFARADIADKEGTSRPAGPPVPLEYR